MKLGPANGNAAEVSDLLQNNGLQLEDFMEKPAEGLKTRYIFIPAAIFIIGLLVVVWFGSSSSKEALTLLYLLTFGGGTWLTVSIQLSVRNGLATFVVAIGALLMLLMADGTFSLQDTADFVKGLRKGN